MPRDLAKQRKWAANYLAKPGNVEFMRAAKRAWKKRNPKAHARSVRLAERRAKERVFAKTGYRCSYCVPSCELPYEMLTVDHVVPLSRGGGNTDENRAAACWTCNRRKGAKTAGEFRDWLRARGELPPKLDADGLPDWSLDEWDAERALGLK